MIGVYNKSNEIDKELLPNQFIIKATHGCGWNIIVEDKSKVDWGILNEKINNWVKYNYFYISGERNYKNLRGRIVIETLLQERDGILKDYKFFCYNGKTKYIMVNTDINKKQKVFYDTDWNKIDMGFQNYTDSSYIVEKPNHFQTMLEVCSKLSSKFNFVRIDLYYLNGKIYFGELTFTPGNGFNKFNEIEFDKLFGEELDIY